MYEVELKVPANHDAVRNALESHDASHAESVTQEDTYYNAPDRDFVETDEALRIRREVLDDGTERTALTYKGPLVDDHSKTREEAETLVEDDAAPHDILAGLGYDASARVTKHRDQFELDGCVVTLDRVEGLGEYVEVEIETEQDIEDEAVLTSLRDEAADVLRKLDLDPDAQIRTSYLDLLLDADAE